MSQAQHILAIDQGTTSTRAIVFDAAARARASARREFKQHYPASGWGEHDPEDIWRDTLATVREVIASREVGAQSIAALCITNQRETPVICDPPTPPPLHPAIPRPNPPP